MSKNGQTSIPFIKKRWPKVIALIGLFAIGLVIALPYALRYSLERWLVSNGAQSAEIKKVNINLFTGTAGIEGLKVKLDNNVVLGDNDLQLKLKLSSLFKKEGCLETGTLSGLILDVKLFADGSMQIGSVKTSASSPEEPEQSTQKTDTSWLFRADYVELKNCLIRFSMPGLEQTIVIDQAMLSHLVTGPPDQPAHLELQGSINDSPLALKLDRIILSSDRLSAGNIKVKGYRLENLDNLLKDALGPFAGSVDLDGKIQFSLSENMAISAQYDGTIGVHNLDIGNSAFSTKSPSISYKGSIHYEQSPDLDIDIDVNGLLRGDNVKVGVPAASLDLLEKNLQLDGKTRVTITNGVKVITDADLDLTDFKLTIPPLHVTHSGLNWQGHVEYEFAGDSGKQTILSNGEISLQKPAYGSSNDGFSLDTDIDNLAWKGLVNIDLGSRDEPLTITSDGQLNGENYQLAIPNLLDVTEDAVLVEGKTKITIGKDIDISYGGHQEHTGTSVKIAGTTSSGSISWKGTAGYKLIDDISKILLDGTLKATGLDSLLEKQQLEISQDEINVTTEKTILSIGKQIQFAGKASIQADMLTVQGDGFPRIKLGKTAVHAVTGSDDGNFAADKVILSNLSVLDVEDKTLLAGMEQINVDKVSVGLPLKVSVAEVTADKGTFLTKDGKKNKPQATLAGIRIKDVAWSANDGLVCDTIVLDSLFGNYSRIKTKKNNVTKKSSIKPEQVQENSNLPLVKINTISVTGKSGFTFTDKVTTVPFQTSLILKSAQIKHIDSSRPETPFTFKIKGKFDKYAPLDITGSSAPFADKLLVKSKIDIRNYSLQRLSPYVIDAIGTKFVNGQIKITSDLTINGNHLDLNNDFLLQKIKAQTVREELLAQLNNKLPVPLDMALSMLRDKKGNIDIKVPVSGPLSNLKVNPTDIIITALSKAIAISVTPYLAYTFLGPAGALAFVAMEAGETLINTDLPHLEFADSTTELTDAQKNILQSIGKKMADHKDQDYSICSKILIWELGHGIKRNFANQQKILADEAARKELLALATSRAENVKKFLLDNFSLNEDHLLICQPGINFDPKGKSSVNFR
jgi:hypothetical protein